MDHHISMPINTMIQCVKIVTKAIEKERKHKRSKKTKNSYIGYFQVYINTDVIEIESQNTTKSVVSCKERLQTTYIP